MRKRSVLAGLLVLSGFFVLVVEPAGGAGARAGTGTWRGFHTAG